jgi:hypothetical protein
MGDCFTSTGSVETKIRIIDPFNKIILNDNINLYITQGNTQVIKLEAGKNLFDHIETKVSEKTLTISNNNKCNWVRSFKKKINLYISLPYLTEMEFYGSGDVQFLNNMQVDTLLLNLKEASGKVLMDLNCNYIELKIHTGPADITAIGATKELVLYNNGTGVLNSSYLNSNKSLAINRNTGKILVNSKDELKAEIYGSGNIFYFGTPQIDFSKNGKGKLLAL